MHQLQLERALPQLSLTLGQRQRRTRRVRTRAFDRAREGGVAVAAIADYAALNAARVVSTV